MHFILIYPKLRDTSNPHSPNDIFTNQHNNQPPLPYNNNLNRFTIKQSFTQTFIATTTPPSPLQHTRFWLGDKYVFFEQKVILGVEPLNGLLILKG